MFLFLNNVLCSNQQVVISGSKESTKMYNCYLFDVKSLKLKIMPERNEWG